jgi:hypothetical protein
MSETIAQTEYSWVNLWGQFDDAPNEIIFRGYTFAPEAPKGGDGAMQQSLEPQQPRGGVGRRVFNQHLTDGTVSLDIQFKDVDPLTTAEVILHHDPITDEMLTAGLGANGVLVNVRYWTRSGSPETLQQQTGLKGEDTPKWKILRMVGDRRMLVKDRKYHLEVRVRGAYVRVELDGVEIASANLPFQLSGKQVGLFCQSQSDIYFRNFRVASTKPLAFVVMQFDPAEYEKLFNDVIVPVCNQLDLEPFRSSQAYYPGIIIADIQRQIRESRVIIAEITPVNPNVYYEVGYADALGKPVILIADGAKLDKLPFDVRAFRTLFYENTIGGKKKIEKTLLDFLTNIMGSKNGH